MRDNSFRERLLQSNEVEQPEQRYKQRMLEIRVLSMLRVCSISDTSNIEGLGQWDASMLVA